MAESNKLMDNPYQDELRRELWEMCVRRDLEAFLSCDWEMTAPDFDPEGFLGIDACRSNDPTNWIPKYTTLDSYRQEFDRQALDFSQSEFADPRTALYTALSLSDPKIDGDRGLIVKTFNGSIQAADGTTTELKWKSIFHLRLSDTRWRFTGFVGYLPLS